MIHRSHTWTFEIFEKKAAALLFKRVSKISDWEPPTSIVPLWLGDIINYVNIDCKYCKYVTFVTRFYKGFAAIEIIIDLT